MSPAFVHIIKDVLFVIVMRFMHYRMPDSKSSTELWVHFNGLHKHRNIYVGERLLCVPWLSLFFCHWLNLVSVRWDDMKTIHHMYVMITMPAPHVWKMIIGSQWTRPYLRKMNLSRWVTFPAPPTNSMASRAKETTKKSSFSFVSFGAYKNWVNFEYLQNIRWAKSNWRRNLIVKHYEM